MRKKKQYRHPFDKWFKRKNFKLVRGKHFNCMIHCMNVQLRNAAARRNIRLSINVDGNTLHVSNLSLIGVKKGKRK